MRSRCTYGRGTVEVRSWYGHGRVEVRSRYGHGTVTVESRFGRGAVEVWSVEVRSRYGRGTVAVRSRYGRGTVEVRSRFGRGTVAMWHVIQCSMVAVQSRYPLGTLSVRSWCSILKVRSSLVFSTRLEPGTRTVRFIVQIVQLRLAEFGSAIDTIPLIRNVLYRIYGLADSDCDKKLSIILIHYYTLYNGAVGSRYCTLVQ